MCIRDRTDTDDEIVVDSSSGGRTTYKNAGKTRRQGAELAWDQRFAGDFRVNASWTWLDATYRSNVCNEQDCNGNRMPGIARNMGFASIGYVPEDGWYAGTEADVYKRQVLILIASPTPSISIIKNFLRL